MKTVTTFEPEVGDVVIDPKSGKNGKITSFTSHCRKCPEWCDVHDNNNHILFCPDVDSLEWDSLGQVWKVRAGEIERYTKDV